MGPIGRFTQDGSISLHVDKRGDRSLPGAVWALGFTSLLMDTSSELIHGLLPVFLVVTLGASATALGVIEGIAEATAQVTRVFSGWLSDVLRRRKTLAVLGYGLAAATKPLFPLANTAGLVLIARFADRVGKGIRGAPRDALLADLAPPEQRGAAFGLRQSLDTLGATLGPVAAIGLMYLFDDDIRTVLWFAVVPAVLAVLVLMLGVKEPKLARRKRRVPLKAADIGELGVAYWSVMVAGAVFTLARFSEAFLVIRARDLGLALALTPAVIAAMSLVYAAGAYPAGRLQDRIGARPVLVFGLLVLIAADVLLAFGTSLFVAFAGIGLWGLHMGLTQGVLSALIAGTAPERLRGTAFGLFGLITGTAALVASVVAGLLWDTIGAEATFLAGAGFAATALLAFLLPKRTPGAGNGAAATPI